MEQPGYLMDTNAVIDYLSGRLSLSGMKIVGEIVNAIPNVSVITKIELLGFNAPADQYLLLSDLMNDSTILNLTQSIVEKTIELRKSYKIKLPDAIIAATALVYDLILLSRNTSDFKDIVELKVVDPHLL